MTMTRGDWERKQGKAPVLLLVIVAAVVVVFAILFGLHNQAEVQASNRARLAAAERQKAAAMKAAAEAKAQAEAQASMERDLAEQREQRAGQLAESAAKDAQAEQDRLDEERRLTLNARRYSDALALFKGAAFDWFANAGEEDRPSSVKLRTTFYSLVPAFATDEVLYKMTVAPGGVAKVWKLARGEAPEEITLADYKTATSTVPYLQIRYGTAYLRTPAKEPNDSSTVEFPPPAEGESYSLAEKELGELHEVATKAGVSMPKKTFEVGIKSKADSQVLALGTFNYDEQVPYEQVAEKVKEGLLKVALASAKRQASGQPVKKFKTTVALYDGRILKKGIDGIVYVPRQRDLGNPNWEKLYAEAERQAKLKEEFESSQRDVVEQRITVRAQVTGAEVKAAVADCTLVFAPAD